MKTKKILKTTSIVLLITFVFIILGAVFTAFLITNDTNLTNNDLKAISADLRIEAVDGTELDYYSKIKSDVEYEDISPYIIRSFIALEDKRFYEHHGLDYKRILGAAVNNVKAGYLKEGGSTITQQLAKNAILTNEKSFVRKLKEAKLAIMIERKYSKEEIITMYLNTIYFGHSLYGVNAACKRIFDKKPSEVTLAEAAMLAGIVKNPLKNSPLNSIENATNRRNLVLNLMFEQGYITESERDAALKESYRAPNVQKTDSAINSYSDAVITEAAKILGITQKEVIVGKFTISTYCDPNAQHILESAYNAKSLNIADINRLMLLADNRSGGVVAYISGVGYSPFDFRRQPASTIKPIIAYTPSFNSGLYSPASPIEDKQYDFQGYSPKNYQNSYLGWTDVKHAVATSSNTCAVKIVNELGIDYAKSIAVDCGLTFANSDGLAAALGGMTYGVTPMELTEAYMTLANGGLHKKLNFISKIKNSDGKVIYINDSETHRAISDTAAYLMTDTLIECVGSGTASKLGMLKYEIAAKTGTSGNKSGNSDAWNMSYSSNYTLCSWYGTLVGLMPTEITGGSYPTLQARYVYQSLPEPDKFIEPIGIIHADIDSYCTDNTHILKLANENTPLEYRRSAIFSAKYLPDKSNFFDNALPLDFEVSLTDNNITLKLTASDKFDYKIRDLRGSEILTIKRKSGYKVYVIPAPKVGLEGYYIEAVTLDGVHVAESTPKLIFVWS